MSLRTSIAILWLAACALAAKPLGREVCVASCYDALLKVKYAGSNETEQIACTNPLRVTSTYYCVRKHCEEEDLVPGIAWWAGTCKKSKKVITLKLYQTAVSNVTDQYIAGLPTVEKKEKGVVNKTAVPSEKSWRPVYRSVKGYSDNRHYHDEVRWIQYGFWGLVILVGIVSNAWTCLRPGRDGPQSTKTNENSGTAGTEKRGGMSKLRSLVKSNLTMSPTFTHHHHQPLGWFTIPTRLNSLVILSYIILHITICAVHYPIYENNFYYKTTRVQVLRILSDRLGVLMSSSLPLLFLFGGRGNILILFTGWSFRTFSIFHRWIAAILVIEGIIHGVTFSAFHINDKGWSIYREKLAKDEEFYSGIMMLMAVGISMMFALGPIRKRVYELFKVAHIVMAAVFLAGFYKHVESQFHGAYKVWTWACVGVWSAEHVGRLLRLLIMNYKVMIGRGTLALASYSEDTGMIRLQVYPSVMMTSRQSPGTHYYLHFPGSRLWENHPFSLAGRTTSVDESPSPLSIGEKQASSPPQVTEVGTDPKGSYLTFMIRPQDGMTRRLRDKLTRKGASGHMRIRVLAEGPYGTPARLGRFNDILFIAGGSGITAVLPYLRSIFEDNNNDKNPPNIRLVWTARNEGFIRDVLANDLQLTRASPLATTNLKESFFVTSGSAATTPESGSSISIRDDGDAGEGVIFQQSRPDVDSIVQSFAQTTAKGRRAAVFVCGPAQMADDVRAAILKQVKGGNVDLELFEEMYGY